MIHFITVHWNSDFWINSQIEKIKTFTHSPYQLYGFFTGIDLTEIHEKYFFAENTDIKEHAEKLNKLAEKACFFSDSPEDLLVFIDSDAFPVAEWETYIRELLQDFDLVAVRRDENLLDPQPHPCFCVTTVKLWQEIKGDWSKGYRWINSNGVSTTDVGGNLLLKLQQHHKKWFPLIRSNTHNLHPLWYAIYGSLVYHHGAGSRKSMSRFEREEVRKRVCAKSLWHTLLMIVCRSLRLKKLEQWLTKETMENFVAHNEKVGQMIKAQILNDPLFYKQFDDRLI